MTAEARKAVEDARRDHHSVFAAAQMVASGSVLAELNHMTKTQSETYRRIMCLEEGNLDPDGLRPTLGAVGKNAGRHAGPISAWSSSR
ncbi:hypothetical protein ACFVT6_37440 [Streptomyces sp. NPDC058049]|uniref:hypothetical protein n=1 Tax=Streptomyces sp. NPDC058049 TaxID=3346314 RepID=UPI0036F0D5A5